MADYTELKKAFKKADENISESKSGLKNIRKWQTRINDYKGKSYSETNFEEFLKLPRIFSEILTDFEILKMFYEYTKRCKNNKFTFDDINIINRRILSCVMLGDLPQSIINNSLERKLELICCIYRDKIIKKVEEIIKDEYGENIENLSKMFDSTRNMIKVLDNKFTNDRIVGEFSSDEYNYLMSIIEQNELGDLILPIWNHIYQSAIACEEVEDEETIEAEEHLEKVDFALVLDSRENEFNKIILELKRIIEKIYLTYDDKDKANREVATIRETIGLINDSLILINKLRNTTEYDEESIDLLDKQIAKYGEIIKKYRGILSAYEKPKESLNMLGNTSNLVFCINNDIDLSASDFQDEYIGAVKNLEAISMDVLCKRFGKKGLSVLKRPMGTNKSGTLIDYIRNMYKGVTFSFVPYRYCSNVNCRTGIIKFEPSIKVKEFLIKKYNLSQQCAVFGVFDIISVIGTDHSNYSILRKYVFDNLESIRTFADLLSSDNPDFEEISRVIDSMLTVKSERLEYATKMLNGGQK